MKEGKSFNSNVTMLHLLTLVLIVLPVPYLCVKYKNLFSFSYQIKLILNMLTQSLVFTQRSLLRQSEDPVLFFLQSSKPPTFQGS